MLAAAPALAALTVTPITWNVVGLDSNNPASGPRNFPVGARVCSTTATTNVVVNWQWDSANAYINLRPGSLSSIAIPSLGAGACSDAYFEVEVAQNVAAYDTARRYHISAADGSGTATTPTPRELYVEHLVSQARNEVSDVKLDGASIPPGGTMTLLVGGTYNITLVGATATQGYNQLQSFINFPNTIFRILAVSTTYTADTSNFVSSPNDRLYADACGWQNNVASPNYLSCVGDPAAGGAGSDGKAGGTVTTTYTVQILVAGAGTTQALNTLIYDFSGSSYHYNGDYAVGARFAQIVNPAPPTFGKAFAPSAIVPGAQSVLTFSIGNSNPSSLANVGFVDALPAGLSIPSSPLPVVSGCGSASVSINFPAATVSVSGATVAANGSCSISIPVSAASAGTYNNTTQPLSVNGASTGLTASATLGVGTTPPGTGLCGVTVARWDFGTAAAPTLVASATGSGVGTATIGSGNGLTVTNDTTTGSPAAASARMYGWQNAGPINTATSDYVQFTIDTDSYSNVAMSFNGNRSNAGPTNIEIWYSVNGGTTWTQKATTSVTANSWLSYGPYTFTAGQTNPTGNTLFRIYGYGANNQNSGADLLLDNLTFTGCGVALQPTLTKTFSPDPITVGGTSTLTFTLANPNSAPLTGTAFFDRLPAGVQVAPTPSAVSTCGGPPTWAPVAGATTLSFAGGTIPAGGSCTASVNVTTASAGAKLNISDFISTTESGTNATATGAATATLNVNPVVLPPVASKSFSPASIAAGQTAILTATLNNTNAAQSLTGVQLVDLYPGDLLNANPLSPPVVNSCGGTLTAAAGGTGFTLTGVTLAPGASCSIEVPVTAATVGAKVNTTSPPQSIEGGPGIPAGATLSVVAAAPAISLSKKVRISPAGPWLDAVVTTPGTALDYQFIVENVGNVPFTSFSVSDPLLAGTGADPAGCVWQTTNLPSVLPTLPVASATLDPTATCVRGPVNAVAGIVQNVATATGLYSGNSYTAADDANYLGAGPNLSLTKEISTTLAGPWSSSIASIAPGSNVYYRFTVANNGVQNVTGISISDPMVSTASCSYVDPLTPGSASVCVAGPVTTAGAPGATITNTATVNGTSGGSPVSATAQASYTLTPASADVSIVKTLTTSAPYVAGQSVTYTLVVANTGPDAASSVQVNDTPTNLAITNVTGGGCSALPCTIPSLAAGASATINVAATISTAGAFDNVASANAATADPNPGNNTDSTGNGGTANASADVSLVKTLSTPGPYTAGQSVTYSIVVANAGPSTATSIQVTDTPSNLSISNVSGGGCSALPCTIPSLAAGASATIAVTASIGAAGAFDNVASATAAESDPNPANNTDNTGNGGTASASADVSVVKTLVTPGPYVVGQTVNYTLSVSNAGPSVATIVQITDTPTNLAITNVTGAGCVSLPCTIPSLASGASATINVTATISAAGAFDNATSATAFESDPNPSNNTDSTGNGGTAAAVADIGVAKTNGTSSVLAGGTTTYTIVVSNAGPSAANGVQVVDTLPAAITTASWTASSAGGATCPASGTGSINASVNLPAGASCTFTVIATLSPLATGTLTNTATATAPVGVTDPNLANNTATDSDAIQQPSADLSITKTDGTSTVTAGGTTTYTIVVANAGPNSVAGALVNDTLPAAITAASWTCAASSGASCPASGSGNLAAPVTIPAGGNVTFTVVASILPAATGTLVNTATVTPPAGTNDPNLANNAATDTDTIVPPVVTADLAITKTDGVTSVVAGNATTYTIVVTNNGPGAVSGATVTDTLPAAIASATWTCAGSGGGTCTAAGNGSIADTVNLPAGASATYTLVATLSGSASGTLVNTATVSVPGGVTDPNPSNNVATDTDTITPAPVVADLAITKTDGRTTVNAGGSTTYTLTVTNGGPGEVSGATVSDTAPPGMTFGTWTCTVTTPGSGGSVTTACGSASGSGNVNATVAMKSGAAITFTVPATVSAAAGATIVNTATVAAPVGVTDSNPANNSASDTNTVVAAPIVADLGVTKTNGVASVSAGGATSYTITVTNAGPDAIAGAILADPAVAGLSKTTVACSATPGQCATPPTVPQLEGGTFALPALAAGATYQIVVGANVTAPAGGSIANVATIAVPSGATDPNPANDSATDTDAVVAAPVVADLAITKTNGAASVAAGGTTIYTITVTNNGPSAVTGAVITDPAAAGIAKTAVACSAVPGSCVTPPSVVELESGAFALPALASGASWQIAVTASVTAAGGTVTNVATIAPPAGASDPNPANNSATDSDTVIAAPLPPDLTVSKSHTGNFTQGQAGATYTLVVSNVGAGATTAPVSVADTLPTGLAAVSIAGTGWSCTLASLTCTRSDPLAAGASYPPITLTVNVAANAPGSVVNTVTVSGGGQTVTTNDTASDTTTIVAPASPDLALTKNPVGTASPGSGGATWLIVVTNAGSGPTSGAVDVVDTLPAGFTVASLSGLGWTCAVATVSCTRSDPLAAGASYPGITIVANVPPGAAGTVMNVATVSGGGDASPANNSATSAIALGPPTPTEIPTLDRTALIALALSIALAGWHGRRRATR